MKETDAKNAKSGFVRKTEAHWAECGKKAGPALLFVPTVTNVSFH